MKKLFFTFLIGLSLTSYGQAPQEVSYQGVARNASGSLLSNQNIGIKLDLHQGSAGGAIVFSETHSKTTNAFGLFTLGIGSVNTSAFTAINWANGPYYMEVSMDPAGGTSYTSVGTQQFMSVPYALYAKTAGNATPAPTITINAPNTVTSAGGGYTINIPASPTYSAGTGISITGGVISNTAVTAPPTITGAGSATVTSAGNTFTINTPASQVYTPGTGIDITGGVITNTATAPTPTITGIGSATVTSSGNTFTINTPTSQVYTPGTGIDITGGVITNTAIAASPTITGAGSATVTSSGNTFTVTTPITPAYTAGTGIDITGGIITSTAAADQTVSITGVGSATVNGTYPNFTVTVPNGTSLPTGFNGQFLFNNGTIWDTLPRPNLYFDGTNFGIGTTAPQANFHVVGAGRFDASVSTPQIYTDNIKITGGTAGQVLKSDASGNGTWQNPITPTVTSTGIAVVTPTTGNNFNVDVPVPVLSYTPGTNVLSLSQGSAVTTATLNGTGSNTVNIVGSGLATVTPTTGSTFTVSVPNPTISIASGSLSISNGNSVAIPSPSLTINSNSLTINGPGGNTVVLPTTASQSLAVSGNSLSITGGNTVTIPTSTISGTGTGIATVTTSANSFTVNVPTQTLTVTSNSVITSNLGGSATITPAVLSYTAGTNTLKLTDGLSVNTVTLNSSSTTSLTQGTNVTVAGSAPNYTVSSVTPTLTVVGGALTGAYPTQTLTIPTSSTTTLTQGANVTVAGSAPNYTVSAPAYSISIPGGNVVQITNGVSTSTSAINATSLTLTGTNNNILSAGGNTIALNTYTPGTGITMTGTAPNYTLSSPNQSLSVSGNSLSITGANTVTIPTASVVAGNSNITVTPSGNTYSVSAVTPTLTVIGGSIAGAYPSQTVTINPATISGVGTGISTVTTSASSFTVNTPAPTYTAASGILSFGGTNTVVVNPVLALSGTTLTSGAATNSVNLSSLSVWSNSVGVLYPTTLTNSVGVGTSGPLTDKMEINYASSSANTHLHLKQTGADAFSRIKFTNAVAPGKFWLSTVTSAASDFNSGYNFFYHNGSIGRNLFTIAGDGKISVNPFSLSYPTLFEVNGGVEMDSTLAVNGLNAMPSTSSINAGKIYYDRASQKFKVSENGSAYVNLIGGASPWIQGTGIITQTNLGDKVGIGTATPVWPLHVYGMADPLQIMVENTGGAFKTGYGIKTATQEWFIGKETGASAGLHFTDITNGATRMAIETNGNVGIGTTNPNSMLEIQNAGSSYGGLQLNMTDVSTFYNGVHVLHQGQGNGGYFEIDNGSSNAYAVEGKITNGTPSSSAVKGLNMSASGNAGNFQIFNSSNSQTALAVTTDGLGQGGYFENTNASNFSSAVYAQSNGVGNTLRAVNTGSTGGAARFDITAGNNGATGFELYHYGTGIGGVFSVNNTSGGVALSVGSTSNFNPALDLGQAGLGYAAKLQISNASNGANVLYVKNVGTGDAIMGEQWGTSGNTLRLSSGNGSNSSATIFAQKSGPGAVAFFENINTTASGNALSAVTYGTGSTIFGNSLGTAGHAGHFNTPGGSTNPDATLFSQNIASGTAVEALASTGKAVSAINASNTNPAIYANNSGTGGALYVNGKVRITDGTQVANYVLTTDGSGNASWQAPSGGSAWDLNGNLLTGTEFLGSSNAQDVVFKAGGAELMRLKSSNAMTFTAGQYSMTASTSGNPAFTLVGSNFQSTQMNIKTTAAVTAVGNLGSIGFSDGTNSTTQAYIQGQREAAGGVAGDLPTALLFYTTADGSGTEGERMRINNAGKVGIGTQLPSGMLHAVNAATTGHAGRFENNSSANTADGVYVTNSGTGAAVHAISAGTSSVGVWLEGGHLKSTAATAPVASTVSVSGITAISLTPTACTDVKGNILAVVTHSGNINSGNSATFRVTFNKPYQVAPTVILTPTTDFGYLYYYVSGITTTSFNVTIRSNTAGTESRTNFGLNYMVIE